MFIIEFVSQLVICPLVLIGNTINSGDGKDMSVSERVVQIHRHIITTSIVYYLPTPTGRKAT